MCVHMPIGVVNNLFILTLCFIYLQVNMQFYRIGLYKGSGGFMVPFKNQKILSLSAFLNLQQLVGLTHHTPGLISVLTEELLQNTTRDWITHVINIYLNA